MNRNIPFMSFKCNSLPACVLLVCALTGFPVLGKKAGTKDDASVVSTSSLWQNPQDIRSRSLYYGPGGEQDQPGHTFTFIKEDMEGTNPKFEVRDENGVKWKVKLGEEAQPETAASRLLWSVGYYTDEDYFVKVLHVANLPHLRRGANLVQPDGSLLNARLKRHDDRKKVGEWSWRKNPFERSREFDGLRVMMALLDNWDLKDENNAILDKDGQQIYEVSDLGATFGTARTLLDKSKAKGNIESFELATFVSNVTPDHVSFGTPAAPPLPYMFNAFDYGRRARMRWIGKDIDRTHVKWIAGLLAQLSPEQIRDAFRAAGYADAEADMFTRAITHRIIQLNTL